MNDKLPPGFEKLTPKILIDMVLAGATARIASGQLTAQDADDAQYEARRLRCFRDSALPDDLWPLLAAIYRLGQIDPNMRLAEAILEPEFRKAQSKPANDGRRAHAIQEVIERLSYEFWDKKPSFKGNPTGTRRKTTRFAGAR